MKKVFAIAAAILCICASAMASETGEYFFKNNISGETRLIDMHMLGAHDAFTASLDENSAADAAGVKLGDSGSKWAATGFWPYVISTSKAQSAHVYELLNNGVRYFDVRLSRYLSGGEFYTTHGRISDQFTGSGGIAREISQWAAQHPGEIIILDFQSLFDIDSSTGGATQDSWRTLASKLEADGIMNYVYTRNGSISSLTYDSLTNGGTRCAIVLFGQVTGSLADSRFINRRDEDGYMRSFWTDTTSFDKMRSKLSEEITELMTNSDGYNYKLRVMQAQTTADPLIGKADENNIKVLTDESYETWCEILPILMVDNATTDAEDFNNKAVEKLARKNREYVNGIYRSTVGNVTLTGNNDNVPLNTRFSVSKSGNALNLSLTDGKDISGKMTLIIKSSGKKQLLYKDGVLLGETRSNGILTAEIDSLGSFVLEDGDSNGFAASLPLIRYDFTDENSLSDLSGNGLDAYAIGSPAVGGGRAQLRSENVLGIPTGITRKLKSYTVSAWVYMTSPTAGSRLFDIGYSMRSSIFAHAGTDKITSGYKYNNGTTVTAQGSGLAVGKWNHVAASCSGGTLTVYLNGKAVAVNTNNDASPDNLNDIFNQYGNFIGRTQWYYDEGQRSGNPDINADIADFRIYDSALSAAEIGRLARVPMVIFKDIDTGEILNSFETDVPTAYNGIEAPEAFGDVYTLVKTEKVTDMAGESNVYAYYRCEEEFTAVTTEENGKNMYAVAVKLRSPKEGTKLYIAMYDDDTLADIYVFPITENRTEVSAKIGEGQSVKAFLWNGDLCPVAVN